MNFQTINHPIKWIILIHVLAGLIALLIFSIPLLSRKGGKLHVLSGWVYVYSMCVVGFSTFLISPWRAFLDPERSFASQGFALFLFYIAILTLISIWFGLRVLKDKHRQLSLRTISTLGPGILLLITGIATQISGYFFNNYILILFPLLGHRLAYDLLHYWWQKPDEKNHWWFAHMHGMCSACIATVTAFLVTALPRLSDRSLVRSPILWIAPGLIGGIWLRLKEKQYREKMSESKL